MLVDIFSAILIFRLRLVAYAGSVSFFLAHANIAISYDFHVVVLFCFVRSVQKCNTFTSVTCEPEKQFVSRIEF